MVESNSNQSSGCVPDRNYSEVWLTIVTFHLIFGVLLSFASLTACPYIWYYFAQTILWSWYFINYFVLMRKCRYYCTCIRFQTAELLKMGEAKYINLQTSIFRSMESSIRKDGLYIIHGKASWKAHQFIFKLRMPDDIIKFIIDIITLIQKVMSWLLPFGIYLNLYRGGSIKSMSITFQVKSSLHYQIDLL